MTKQEKLHLRNVAALGCAACRRIGINDSPCEIHHIREGRLGKRSDHMDAIPLCPRHHRVGPEALHVKGRKAWERHFGFTEMDLLEDVRRLLA